MLHPLLDAGPAGRLLLAGLVFWILGSAVWAHHPWHRTSRLSFLLSQLSAGLLAAGTLARYLRLAWTTELCGILVVLLAAVALHYFSMLREPISARMQRWLARLTYTGAGFLLVAASLEPPASAGTSQFAELWMAGYLYIVVTVLVGAALLFHRLRTSSLPVRRRRLLVGGLLISHLSLVLLWLAVDYTWILLVLSLTAVAVTYVATQGEPDHVDLLLNRGLVYTVVTTLLLACCAILLAYVDWLIHQYSWGRPLVLPLVALLLVRNFGPLRAWLQRRVDDLFYGGWYSYRALVRTASTNISRAPDKPQLAGGLLALARNMRFKAAVLLWPADSCLATASSYGYHDLELPQLRIPGAGNIARYLCASAQPRWQRQIAQALAGQPLTLVERALLTAPSYRLWLPLVSGRRLHGVLILGQRRYGDRLDDEDLDILTTLAAQAAVAAENVNLLEALRKRLVEVERIQAELNEAHARLAESRESERLHLAQELHDGPVQDLYAVHFQLGALEESVQDEEEQGAIRTIDGALQEVTRALRVICGELRPPALAPFGLGVAIRSHAGQLRDAHPLLKIHLELACDGQTLSERVRLALFRIYQESLNNVVQHSGAREVLIRSVLDAEQIVLEIEDDGVGFMVPERWIELARRGHLGLLGIAERATAIGGQLEVVSAPGQGTLVKVIAPRSTGDYLASSCELVASRIQHA